MIYIQGMTMNNNSLQKKLIENLTKTHQNPAQAYKLTAKQNPASKHQIEKIAKVFEITL